MRLRWHIRILLSRWEKRTDKKQEVKNASETKKVLANLRRFDIIVVVVVVRQSQHLLE